MLRDLPQVQPWEPDFNFFMGSMEKKQQQYDAGWQKTNNLYNSLLNAPMMREDNLSKRNHYFNQIANDIQRISSLDLSLAQNVTAAAEVFDPVINDDYIINDISWTKKYQREMQTSEYYRNCTDPKKCGDKYWKTGVQALQYMADDFKNVSADEALRMPAPRYVPYSKELDNVYEKLKNAGLGQVKRQRMSKDGRWMITETNGGQEYLSSLMGYLTQTLGNSPELQDMYWAKAYTQRKGWMSQNGGNYNSPEEAYQAFYAERVQPAIDGLTTVRDQVSKDADKAVSLSNTMQKNAEKTGIIPGSEEHKFFLEIQGKAADLLNIKDGVSTTIKNTQNTENNTSYAAKLMNYDYAAAEALLYGDILKTAMTYQGLTYEFDLEANPYALAAYKDGLSRQAAIDQSQLNINEYLAKKTIDWRGQALGFGGSSKTGSSASLLNRDQQIKLFGSEANYMEKLYEQETPEEASDLRSIIDINPITDPKITGLDPNNPAISWMLDKPATLTPDTYIINAQKEEELKNTVTGMKAQVISSFLDYIADEKADPSLDVEYDMIFGNIATKYNDYALARLDQQSDFEKRLPSFMQNSGLIDRYVKRKTDVLPYNAGELRQRKASGKVSSAEEVLNAYTPAEIDQLYDNIYLSIDPNIGGNKYKTYLENFMTPEMKAMTVGEGIANKETNYKLISEGNKKRWDNHKDAFLVSTMLGEGTGGLSELWKTLAAGKISSGFGSGSVQGPVIEDLDAPMGTGKNRFIERAILNSLANIFAPVDERVRGDDGKPYVADYIRFTSVLSGDDKTVNLEHDEIIQNGWNTMLAIVIPEFTDSQGKKRRFTKFAQEAQEALRNSVKESNPDYYNSYLIDEYGDERAIVPTNMLKSLYYGFGGEEVKERGVGNGIDDYHRRYWADKIDPWNSLPYLHGAGAERTTSVKRYKPDPAIVGSAQYLDTKTIFMDIFNNKDNAQLMQGMFNRENIYNLPEYESTSLVTGPEGGEGDNAEALKNLDILSKYYENFYYRSHNDENRPIPEIVIGRRGDYIVGNIKLDREFVKNNGGTKTAPGLTGTSGMGADYEKYSEQGINFYIPAEFSDNNFTRKSVQDEFDNALRYNGEYDGFRNMYPGTADFSMVYDEEAEQYGFDGYIYSIDGRGNPVAQDINLFVNQHLQMPLPGDVMGGSKLKAQIEESLSLLHAANQQSILALKQIYGEKDINKLLNQQ
jgi:hypothetical protein